jgi:hypothetical protein
VPVRECVLCGRGGLRGCDVGVRVPFQVVVPVVSEDLVRLYGRWLLLRTSRLFDVQGGGPWEFRR